MLDNSILKKDIAEGTAKRRQLGLYIHIPFCIKKCDYCDFLSAPADEETKRRYFDALITEIWSYKGKTEGYMVPTIFIGGGTPSAVTATYIHEILEAIGEIFYLDKKQLEATIELNPGTVTKEKLETYKESGINRLSFGLQSTDNNELKLLGRIHTYEQFEENYLLAREVGFQNINIDLMSALPGQTIKSWETTLNQVIRLKPEHISAYSLIIEEGTPFYRRYGEGLIEEPELPDEETDRLIYSNTKDILEANGYHRYEISNYAKNGYECRHNSSYWSDIEYLGIGLGASSLINGARFSNLHDLEQYISLCKGYKFSNQTNESNYDLRHSDNITIDSIGIRIEHEALSIKQRMEEFMFLGLRMSSGISRESFQIRFHTSVEAIYGKTIQALIKDKLLVSEGDRIYLTDYGIDVSNVVFSQFLLD